MPNAPCGGVLDIIYVQCYIRKIRRLRRAFVPRYARVRRKTRHAAGLSGSPGPWDTVPATRSKGVHDDAASMSSIALEEDDPAAGPALRAQR